MNLSRCISSLKMSLGLYGITLPFKDEVTGDPVPTENVIRDVLTTTTIPLYSEFVPWIREYDESVKNLKKVDNEKNIYIIPPFLTITPIKYVLDVKIAETVNTTGYGGVNIAGINRSARSLINAQEYMMLAGEMRAEPTFEYLGENKIRLYGFPNTVLTFKVAAEHDESGESIPSSCYDSFMELATLDVKIFLYNTLKLYEIPSAFGQVNLKIEDFQSADSDKTSLLNEWRDRFHLDLQLWEWM